MFPTFISILDIQSWWEVPSIAHFCSLFRTAFNLLDFDIEDLEEALLTDGTEESSWLQELIVKLLSGCLPNNEISTFNYQMFLRRLFRQKCQEHDRYNPFNTDCDFTLLPLRTKVDILHALCDFRLDAEDVLDQLKNLEADSLRVEPLGYDKNDSAYWYFYGTRLYREDFQKKNNKKKSVWQVICFTEDDWFQLTKKFKSSNVKNERALYHTLSKNFLPELPRLFKEKERQARRRLLENQPRRTSDRIGNLDTETIERGLSTEENVFSEGESPVKEEYRSKKEKENERKETYEKPFSPREKDGSNQSGPESELRHEMASKKRSRGRQRKVSTDSSDTGKEVSPPKRKKTKASEKHDDPPALSIKPTVGRQTNNSLSALDGQIVIQQGSPSVNSNKKKLKTSQVFQQTDEDLLVGMHKILDFVKNHEDAWPFLDPVEEEYAPNYYSIIRRPMDLTRMEDRLDQGYYKTFEKFKSDFQLIVNNCRLYNGAENEYTQMVDNLVKVFEKATQKYLDEIYSSDEEIAVENLNSEEDSEEPKYQKLSDRKRSSDSPQRTENRIRKPALAAEGKKRERSPSAETYTGIEEELVEAKPKKSKKPDRESRKEEKQSKKMEKEVKECKKSDKEMKKVDKEVKKVEKDSVKLEKQPKKVEKESKKLQKESKISEKIMDIIEEIEPKKIGKAPKSKKENKLEYRKENKLKDKRKKPKKRGRKKKKGSPVRSQSCSRSLSSRSPSPSPPRSMLSTPPPSSPEDLHEHDIDLVKEAELTKEDTLSNSNCSKKPSYPWEVPYLTEEHSFPPNHTDKDLSTVDKKLEELSPYSPLAFSFKPAKDKHNKLRETIEKLKAKSEISRLQSPMYDLEVDDQLKENKDKNKKNEDRQSKTQHREKPHSHKIKKNHQQHNVQEHEVDNVSQQLEAVVKKSKKKDKEQQSTNPLEVPPTAIAPKPTKQSNFEALSLATEQTLKDINKWLDDTPKFADFSSASNSPSYLPLDEFELLGTPRPLEPKKVEKVAVSTAVGMSSPVHATRKEGPPVPTTKELKKKTFRDPSKFFNKRREVQRTIDRLQPGKSKGNLISNVQNATKADEIFPLGVLSKIKDTKNSLIVKTDTNAPKLSLGSVLDSFGKHKFVVDDQKKDEEGEAKPNAVVDTTNVDSDKKIVGVESKNEEKSDVVQEAKDGGTVEKDAKEAKVVEESNLGGPTPNLSAWFKAFGAPKALPPPKKSDNKADTKEEEPTVGSKSERVPPADTSPSLESPQTVTRQRRISTGSSMSERSSFSQDLDSPRVGMEERGAYPAPYPSPLHRSPSNGASPVMASPRPDISPRSPYPFSGGQMRVGFYQDTVASSKSSPDKSCSPRENPPNSPYYQPTGPEHVYAPNTTQGGYSASYSANSPYYTHPPSYSSTNPTPPYNLDGSSNSYYDTSKIVDQYQAKTAQNYTANSPASSQPSPAPQPQLSPHSPVVHHSQTSPSVHSPSIHSPTVQSPSVHSPILHSPSMHSPSVHSSQHSHSPQLPSPGQSLHSPGMSVVSPQVNSPGVQHSPMALNSPSMPIHSPMNPASVEAFHTPQDETSNVSSSGVATVISETNRQSPTQQQASQSVFPVKKRALLDADLSSSFSIFQDEIVSRSLQVGHQLTLPSTATVEQEVTQSQSQHHLQQQGELQKHRQALQKQHLQEAQEQLLQKHQEQLQKQQFQEAQEQLLQKQQLHKQQLQEAQGQLLQKRQQQLQHAQDHILQQAHEQILQQAQLQQQKLQQQKNQQILQQQKTQQILQEQQNVHQVLQEQQQQHILQEQKKQQQLLQEQKQQQFLQQQKNLQMLQQQAMAAAFAKANTGSTDQSLRTPSPPALSQQQTTVSVQQQHQNQRNQQLTLHNGAESSASSLRSMSSYPMSTSSQSSYTTNITNRDSYTLNVPSGRTLPSPHQQKLDMSKFTNMGYSGPEVNFSRALQQQYSRPELSYTRTTVQSAISQASQLLSSQALSTSQTSASSTTSLPGYQKSATNQHQAHSATYQSGRSVDSVAERLAAQAQQEVAGYKQDSRSTYNSTPLDLEQALGLSRNISNIVDRYSNEQRMMAGLQTAPNAYYSDKGLGTSHMFNKQIFSQGSMTAMGYGQQQQQQTMQQPSQATAQSLYGRQMAAESQTSHDLKSSITAAQSASQDRKQRKKKSVSKGNTSDSVHSVPSAASSSSSSTPSQSVSAQQHGFQSYAGLKASPVPSGSTSLDPAAIALKTSGVPGSAFNFGSGALGMSTGLSESYPNLLDDFRGTSNYFMGGANAKPGQSGQGYPPFLNPAAHQGRSAAYPLGGPFMDTSSQLYQHYLQAGVLNQGLLGAAASGYPPGYHAAALAMRQPYDSISRPSWL